MSEKPDWMKLISYWVIKMKRDGLTIPFILGVKNPPGNLNADPATQILELLSNVVSYKDDDNIVTLFCCETIGEIVLGLVSRNLENITRANLISYLDRVMLLLWLASD